MSMIKTCQVCGDDYKTKEGRQKACSKPICGNTLRSLNATHYVPTDTEPTKPFVSIDDLPPVEALPAEYVKRCYDFWSQLTGDGPMTRRIG